jgi:hypothetical protein
VEVAEAVVELLSHSLERVVEALEWYESVLGHPRVPRRLDRAQQARSAWLTTLSALAELCKSDSPSSLRRAA